MGNLIENLSFLVRSLTKLKQRRLGKIIQVKQKYSTLTDGFLNGNSGNYIDEMYLSWKKDPNSVHTSWNAYFKILSRNGEYSESFMIAPKKPTQDNNFNKQVKNENKSGEKEFLLKVQQLLNAYRKNGHRISKIDPLNQDREEIRESEKEFELEKFSLSDKDLETEIRLNEDIFYDSRSAEKKYTTLKELIEKFKNIYCGKSSVEYAHISSQEKIIWLQNKIERPEKFSFSPDKKKLILKRLMKSSLFELFLSTKFPNAKKFGLEGSEPLVPGIMSLIDKSSELGVESFFLGMPHRGRLNILSNIGHKPNEVIFSEFQNFNKNDEIFGDVKYHLGTDYAGKSNSGKNYFLSITPNPSHLEAEIGVVLGMTRATQFQQNDDVNFAKSLSIILHGDASFSGQGVVYETFNFMNLPAFKTGGSIHVINNNQIGFTTNINLSRSTFHLSDLAKAFDVPVFHVNSDDIEQVIFFFDLAAQWRKQFKSDVVIDLVSYRKNGHNETDQPAFTQPIMYQIIQKHEPSLSIYLQKLIKEGVITTNEFESYKQTYWDALENSFSMSKDSSSINSVSDTSSSVDDLIENPKTSIDLEKINFIIQKLSDLPKDFELHKNLERIFSNRKKLFESNKIIDWGTAELLAYGSLLLNNVHVRLTGQDVQRGTFSHRHAVLVDQKNEKSFVPLNNLSENQSLLTISNSSLSEYGVLAFEFGYSVASKKSLVQWEAQFGDFANTAQVMFDQFISGSETKWGQDTSLVVSLPHGYDGQGPEHSSGRIERFLQLCNENESVFTSSNNLLHQHQNANMLVAYPTIPSNLFHLLRLQVIRKFKKPLIIFVSKSLLRHPLTKSSVSEFTGDSAFQWVIDDKKIVDKVGSKDKITRLILCTGQIYAALHKERSVLSDETTSIVRIEQLHPFPYAKLLSIIDSYKNLTKLIWCQEEPLNMGAYSYIKPRVDEILKKSQHVDLYLRYAGRSSSASVATGFKVRHDEEEKEVLLNAFK